MVGTGLQKWFHVAKAKPLSPGHYEPKLSEELGFYDLLVPETNVRQAELAKFAGVEGTIKRIHGTRHVVIELNGIGGVCINFIPRSSMIEI